MRRYTAVMLLVIILLSFASSAEAYQGYGEDDDENYETFTEEYGWDTEKMSSYIWIGTNGELVERQNTFELSSYNDMVESSMGLASDYGIVYGTSGANGTADLFVSIVKEEYDWWVTTGQRPSSRVKYNDYCGSAWCCRFVSYCAGEAGLLDIEGQSGIIHRTGGCGQMTNFFHAKGYDYWLASESECYGGDYAVLPGDILIWDNTEHIGVIVDVGENYLEIIEGNHGQKVTCIKYYKEACYRSVYNILGLRGAIIYRIPYPDDDTTIYNFLTKSLKLPTSSACGILANLQVDSGLKYDKSLYNSKNELVTYGIAQWRDGDLDRLRSYCQRQGLDWKSLTGQLMFLKYELEHDYPDLLNALRKEPETARGSYDAAELFCRGYEKDHIEVTDAVVTRRASLAQISLFPKFSK